MQVPHHMRKISKLETLRARFDPMRDFELWFWTGMTAGTHAVNAALHHAKVTLDDDVFPTQPGVYLVPQPDGSLKPSFRQLGDVLHINRPKINAEIPEDVAAMMQQMEIVERYRDPCIREGLMPTLAIVHECDAALRQCFQLLNGRVSGSEYEN